jgi:hypothetical protein
MMGDGDDTTSYADNNDPRGPPIIIADNDTGGEKSEAFSSDDLIELVRAVRFAHTDMSIRRVHNEISVSMANSDPSYAFLKEVKFNDVKKVWRKALKGTKSGAQEDEATTLQPEKSSTTQTAGLDTPTVGHDGILKFYTVGDGSVKFLVENYSKHYAEAAMAASNPEKSVGVYEKGNGRYTHFFLDVPADLSGSRPHQALINYQDMQKSCKGKRSNSNTKKQTKQQSGGDVGREVFKIQIAALPPGMESEMTPMLLYNADRSAKTFLHPPTSSPIDADCDDDDGGYMRIRQLISQSGTSGILGATGGQKVITFISFDSLVFNSPVYVTVLNIMTIQHCFFSNTHRQ